MERRFVEAQQVQALVEEDAQTRMIGYAAPFNQRAMIAGLFMEEFLPGAFAETIARDDIRALWCHDRAFLLGRNRTGTLELAEDEYGLRIVAYPPATPLASSFVENVRRGDVDTMSFEFKVDNPEDEEWTRTDAGVVLRRIRRARLREVSFEPFAAYSGTSADVRSVFGEIPVIPADVRGATASAVDEVLLRARRAYRVRQIELIGV